MTAAIVKKWLSRWFRTWIIRLVLFLSHSSLVCLRSVWSFTGLHHPAALFIWLKPQLAKWARTQYNAFRAAVAMCAIRANATQQRIMQSRLSVCHFLSLCCSHAHWSIHSDKMFACTLCTCNSSSPFLCPFSLSVCFLRWVSPLDEHLPSLFYRSSERLHCKRLLVLHCYTSTVIRHSRRISSARNF